jgi:glutathione S-transferase
MTPSITIQYWPLRARASGLFQMLAEGGIDYEHETNLDSMTSALFAPDDCTFTALLPPILIDRSGETTVTFSQTIPIFQYLGEKYGFNKGIPEVKQVALQYMHDLNDLHIEMSHQAAVDLKAGLDVSNLQAYLSGDRYKKHLKSIDRCIQGPFYFGEDPTYVDFAVLRYGTEAQKYSCLLDCLERVTWWKEVTLLIDCSVVSSHTRTAPPAVPCATYTSDSFPTNQNFIEP